MALGGSRRLRILVVDDYPDARATLGLLLELTGHSVRLASGGAEALAVAAVFQPEVVFLDIEMPLMHGGEVARRLRQMGEVGSMMIVATTGTDPCDSRIVGYQLEFDEYLCKPYSLERLERVLANYSALPRNKPTMDTPQGESQESERTER